MARTLSRIAQFGIFLATTAIAWPAAPRARADGGVQVGTASETVQNPFTTRALDPQPTTAPPVESGPRMYQNPFSASANSLPAATSPSRGTLSRWRRPTQRPSSAPTNPLNPAATANASPRPAANNSWDVLTPSQLEEAEAKPFARPAAQPNARVPAPPDPISYGSDELQQPAWLVPAPASTADAAPQTNKSPYLTPARPSPRAAEAIGRTTPIPASSALPSFGVRQPDPFEASDAEANVANDENTAREIRPETPRFVPPKAELNSASLPAENSVHPAAVAASPAECYDRAQRAAETAESADQLAQVAQLCQQGLAVHAPRDLATRLRSLAAWARNRHGELQSEAGHDDEGLADFNAALALDPNCWLALHNRAVSFAQQGHGDDALRDFNRVIQLSPGMAIAYRNRGELLASMGRSEEAVADYGRAIAQLPQEADLYEIRGHALHRLGRYQEALADLDRAIKLSPRDADAYTHRGNVYAELGDYGRATDDFKHALTLNANCADAYRSLAWLESTCPDERFRDSQQAVAAAERAAKLSPKRDCFVLDALAAAHASAGDFDRAASAQREAMAVAPQSFASQFAERLALYEQHRPYRNGVAGAAADGQVRAASHEAPPAVAAPSIK
jgi:tetratricopeptide (TPR) repeat protein